MAKITKYASSNPQELARELKSNKELAKMYEKRVSSAMKRVSKIESRFGRGAVTSSISALPESAEGLNRQQMLKGLAQANRYIKSDFTTVSGYRKALKREREQFQERGMGKFSEAEMIDVNQLLDEIRAIGMQQYYPSDYYVEYANLAASSGINKDEFSRIIKRASNRGLSKDQLMANFEHWKNNPSQRHYIKLNRSSSDDF